VIIVGDPLVVLPIKGITKSAGKQNLHQLMPLLKVA